MTGLFSLYLFIGIVYAMIVAGRQQMKRSLVFYIPYVFFWGFLFIWWAWGAISIKAHTLKNSK